MIHWLIKPLVPEVTFHAWVKPIKSIKVSDAYCMDHQGPKEISKATDLRLLLCLVHILQIYESENSAAPVGQEPKKKKSHFKFEPNTE